MDGNRRIDAMVAERVMGWIRKTNRHASGYADDHVFEEPDEWWDELDNNWYDGADPTDNNPLDQVEDGTCREDGEGWYPSTRIAAAWEVVEKMRELGRAVLITASPFGTAVSVVHIGDHPVDKSVLGACKGEDEISNPAMSICLAALRAVGVSEQEISDALEAQ